MEERVLLDERAAGTARVLTREQLGHLRHIDNLSQQLPNDWSFMQSRAVGQYDFGGLRYQLAYMAYALGLTHLHHLPNAPGVFKPAFERLITKLLSPEVWLYWRDVSRGGASFNAHRAGEEQWDPVARDNIMYSAYVHSLVAMYHYLFADDRYAHPGAISFEFWSFFWGGESRRFVYDEHSLNEHLYWQMAESGFIGVACEPNCSFQICNQPAILGFRMHDLATGGDLAAEVTRSYEDAWATLGGRLDSTGHYNKMLLQDSGAVVPSNGAEPWVDAWCGTMMNMWNRDFVRRHYRTQIAALVIDGPGDTRSVPIGPPREVLGQVVENDDCDFGWVATWASEMGDDDLLAGLLAHADTYMNPTWHDGGLYFPRNDTDTDENGNRTLVEPLTGNALLAYARLNVPDGMWKLYNEPWGSAHFAEPSLTSVSSNVEVSEARYDEGTRALSFRLQHHEERRGDGEVVLGNVFEHPEWSLLRGDRLVASGCAGTAEVRTDHHVASGLALSYTDAGLRLWLPPGAPQRFQLQLRPMEVRR
jgi:hypothetical protein